MDAGKLRLDYSSHGSDRDLCPVCHRPMFRRYRDDKGNYPLPAYVGRCDDSYKCRYYYREELYAADLRHGIVRQPKDIPHIRKNKLSLYGKS